MRTHLLLSAALGGCVLSPTDRTHVDSRLAALDFEGYAAADRAPLQLRAWNHDRQAWEPLRDFKASSRTAGQDVVMYQWDADDVLVGTRYWLGSTAACDNTGMARFQVRERDGSTWYPLKTFDETGQACLSDEILSGTDFYEAGVACNTGETVLLFAFDACVTVPSYDPTPPRVVLRATDDDQAWEQRDRDVPLFNRFAIPTGRTLRLRGDVFDTKGPRAIAIDYSVDLTCRNSAGGTHTVRRTYRAVDDQPVTAGTEVHGTLGVAAEVSRTTLASACATGYAPRSASIDVTATGENAGGLEADTAALRFSMTF